MSGLRERPPRPAAPHTWAPATRRTRCGGLGATGPSLGAQEPPGRRLGPQGAGPLRQEPPPGPGPGPSDGRLVGLINAAGRGGVTAVNKQIGKPQTRGLVWKLPRPLGSPSPARPLPDAGRPPALSARAPRVPGGTRAPDQRRAHRQGRRLHGDGSSRVLSADDRGGPRPPPAAPPSPVSTSEAADPRDACVQGAGLASGRRPGCSTASSPSGATCLSPGAFASPPPAPGPRLSEPAHVLARQALNAFH